MANAYLEVLDVPLSRRPLELEQVRRVGHRGVARLGELLLHAEQDSTILGSVTNPIDILAFCTGEVPAAVALAAQDIQQLFALAVETVSMMAQGSGRATHTSL